MALSDDFPVAFLTNMGGGYAVLLPIDAQRLTSQRRCPNA